MSRLARATADQRGMVLPLTLMFVIILATLSVALLTVGGHETLIAANHLKGVHALFLAEAGLEDAFNTFRNSTSLLTTSDNSLKTLSSVACVADSTASACSTLKAYGGYSVQYQSAGTDTVRVVVTGYTGTSGSQTATRVLRAILTQGWTSTDAVRTKDSLTINGNQTVSGSCGSVHTNSNLTLIGNSIDVDVQATASGTASGTYDSATTNNVSAQPSQASKSIPSVSAATALTKALSTLNSSTIYKLQSNGTVVNGAGTTITTLTEWSYDSGTATWTQTGNTATAGTFYVEGNVGVGGGAGSSGNPWNATILATGDIVISGSPYITAHLTDTLLVADKDISIAGNANLHNGVIGTHEQIALLGNVSITGSVVAEGAASTSSTVTANDISSGHVTITYQCGMQPPFPGDLTILASGF